MKASTKSITQEELDEKISSAEEAHELKAGTRYKVYEAALGKAGVTIKYAKIVTRDFADGKGDISLREFESSGVEKLPFLPHNDLTLAFELLRSHLMIACMQKDAYDAYGEFITPMTFESYKGAEKDNPLNRYKVSGFAINDSETGVILTGHRYNRGKATLPLSQYADFFGGENAYEFGDELSHVITHVRKEVLAYFHGKIAPDSQMDIDFDEAAGDLE